MTDREQPEQDEAPPQAPPAPSQTPAGGYPPYGYPPPQGHPPQAPPPGYAPAYPPQGPPGYPPQGYPPPGYPPHPPPPPGPQGHGWGQVGPQGWQAWPQQVAVPRPPAAPVEQIPPDERTLSALAYLVPLFTSAGLLLVDKRRPAVRFHAAQALALDVVVAAACFLLTAVTVQAPALLFLYLPVLYGGFTLPRLFLLVQSARGKHVRLPWLADLADARARTALPPPGPQS